MRNPFSFIFIFLLTLACTPAEETASGMTEIFNGSDLEGWQIPDNNIWWSVEDGMLKAASDTAQTGSILWTEKEYGDFIVQADFKMGEGTVDSGIFLRSDDQQIQIGESGSLKRDMTASPYIAGEGYPVEAEGVQKLLKMDGWNTLKVKAQGGMYTTWLNGQEVMNYTAQEVQQSGPIGLQLHPNRDMTIDFRNIMVEEI